MTDNKNIIPDYDLLAKYFAGEASVTQTKAIENWVTENPVNKKSYDRIHFLWMQSAKKELEEKVNVTDAWTKMKFRMNAATQATPVSPPEIKEPSIYKKTTRRLLQFAAIIVIALGVNALLKIINAEPDYISTESQLSAVSLTLPDNSEIRLNKESKISYPEKFKGKKRKIKLEGEAFFEVEPDKEKPFIVETEFAKIEVVGTSFNVQAYDTSNVVEITVVSGVVKISGLKGGQSKTLRKGEKGKIDKETGIPIKEINEVEDELHWMTKKLIFKDTELSVIAETLAKAYNVEIEFGNEKIKSCKWDIVLEDMSIEAIMDLLQGTYTSLIIEQTDNKFTINGTSCQ